MADQLLQLVQQHPVLLVHQIEVAVVHGRDRQVDALAALEEVPQVGLGEVDGLQSRRLEHPAHLHAFFVGSGQEGVVNLNKWLFPRVCSEDALDNVLDDVEHIHGISIVDQLLEDGSIGHFAHLLLSQL